MKLLLKIFCFIVVLFMLVGCAGNKESTIDSSENSSVLESTEEDATETEESTKTSELKESRADEENDISAEESANNDSDNISSGRSGLTDGENDISAEEPVKNDSDSISFENSNSNAGSKEDKEKLSQYSNEQIEYARIWSQLGPNQELDGLYVRKIPAGTQLNPDDETSASYPDDVIQLAGSRLVDGSINYSSNGNGTINVYNIPLRWDGNYPAGEKFYIDIIENTELVYVDLGNDEEIIELIQLLNVNF